MNRKQLLLIVGGLLLAGIFSLVLSRKDASAWEQKESSKLLSFDLNEVSQITLRQRDRQLNLTKKEEVWSVKERADYPANFQKVSDLLRKMWELKSVQAVKVGPSQLGRLELVEPGKGPNAGSVLEFKNREGKPVGALLVGKQYMRQTADGPEEMPGYPVGRYVMALGENKVPSLVNDPISELELAPESWLNTSFVNITNIRSITVTGSSSAWKVSREKADADWKLEGAKPEEQLDSAQASGFGSLLANVQISDVLAPDAKDFEAGQPVSAEISTFDDFTYTLTMGQLKEEKIPVKIAVSAAFPKERAAQPNEKPEDKEKLDKEFQTRLKELQEKLAKEQKFQQRGYVLAKYTISGLLKERKELLKAPEPKPTPSPTAAAVSPTPSPAKATKAAKKK